MSFYNDDDDGDDDDDVSCVCLALVCVCVCVFVIMQGFWLTRYNVYNEVSLEWIFFWLLVLIQMSYMMV